MTGTSPLSIAPAALSGTARPDEREKLKAAAGQFEAIFVRQMLSVARKAGFEDDLFGGQAMQTFRQMQDDHFADLAAQTGALGLAAMIEAQLARYLPAEIANETPAITATTSTAAVREP